MSAMRKVNKTKNFDSNEITLEDNSSGKYYNIMYKGQKMPYIQLEEMYIPFGVRVTNEPYEKAELTLSPYNKSNANVTEFFKNIDKSIVKLLSTDSKKYLGKKMSKGDVEDNYYPFVRQSVKNDREYTNFTFRVPQKDSKFLVKVFEKGESDKPQSINFDEDTTFEGTIRAGRVIKPIIRLVKVWITQKGKIGLTFEISQIMLSKRESSGWMGADSDDDAEDEEETTTPAATPARNEVVDDSDEDKSDEDNSDEDDSEDESEDEPEPEPVKKASKPKIVVKKKK